MGVIPAGIGALSSKYPRRDVQDPALYQYVNKVMAGIPGTPCCAQMSHALNMCGIKIPASSYRRPNQPLNINGVSYSYILATDELEVFLTRYCGDGEMINKDLDKTRTYAQIRQYITNRPGLIIFRFSAFAVPPPKGEFEHTELWDGMKTMQQDMALGFLFARPRVLMWDTNDPARWLVDYMKTQT